ncbi:hypothetical protein SCLCIDRAFT_1066608 [Scleroderma citrinum Foug A]|uniref:Uncharacterized protein n=1 Tax=Scleroderma citrinum Foug A TaxID=1036808 RepID=A0A0C3E4K6_9AGAM|nr:hypothetical protein SCLCIDRAFT_1066608 [Scleroderma citrinum Foug A]
MATPLHAQDLCDRVFEIADRQPGINSTIASLKEKITAHLHANHPSLASSRRFKAASLAVTNTGEATPFSPPLGATTGTTISTARIPPASAPVSAQQASSTPSAPYQYHLNYLSHSQRGSDT